MKESTYSESRDFVSGSHTICWFEPTGAFGAFERMVLRLDPFQFL